LRAHGIEAFCFDVVVGEEGVYFGFDVDLKINWLCK
jgi:hypothetical protein